MDDPIGRSLYISRAGVNIAIRDATGSVLLARAAALERQASMCDCLFPWPALAASFREDAQRLILCAEEKSPLSGGQSLWREWNRLAQAVEAHTC